MRVNPEGRVRLSQRQAQILRMLCAEAPSTKEIAYRLTIAEATVAGHLDQMIRGLKLGSRQRLVLWAWQHPGALGGAWADPEVHPPGCECGGCLCAMLLVL